MISVKIPNLPKFQKALKKYPQFAEKEIRNAFEKSLYQVIRETKPITPVDTGRLRGSIGETNEGIFKIERTKAMVGTNVKYAIYVHEGARGRIGRPFLKQGLEKSKNKIGEFFRTAIDNTFNKISKESK